MKLNHQPFKIGMEIENFEFDIVVLNLDCNGYEKYKYLKEISVDSRKPKKVELYFLWDVLKIVVFHFSTNNIKNIELPNTENYIKIQDKIILKDYTISMEKLQRVIEER